MTLLTLRFLRVRLRGLTTKPNGEYGKGTLTGVALTVELRPYYDRTSQYSDFSKRTSSLFWEPLGNGRNVSPEGRQWPVRCGPLDFPMLRIRSQGTTLSP